MKKFSLFIAALALVLGTSQCRKEDKPLQNGEKQHIVLTANNGNDGSKVSADFDLANLNLTWEGNEVITVSGGATGTLGKITVDQSNPSKATFEGDIEITDESELLEFTVGDTPNYEGQPGTEDGCEGWIKNNISLTGTDGYDLQGQYSADMKLPYAVLKLNVSALGTSGVLTISVGTSPVASVGSVTAPSEVFVAVPADGSLKNYTIGFGGKTATKEWKLDPNTFYTKSDGEGEGTGDAIVIEPATPTTPKFTVGMDGDKPITVEFAPGNLWYGTEDDAKPVGKAFHFEANQWSFASTWDESHVSHFFWSKTASVAYAASYSDGSAASGDVFFTNATETTANENFQVSGETKGTWRTLSNDEWAYLLNTSGSSGRNDVNRFAKALVNGVKGLLIFPDGYTLPSGYTTADGGTGMAKVNKTSSADAPWPDASIPETTWTLMESAGVVFLPAAGSRNSTSVINAGSGYYWSTTTSAKTSAYRMQFISGAVSTGYIKPRSDGSPVRLVRDVK